MPLFVPILRLLMLFLNVYDSYKTLKEPQPSSRNGGRPSIRAMSQRKRDMKGCLAVWIVWAALSIYERLLESVISLFIPFYDEFKSLALIFLILTRARGAEPIYLHLIRPLIKPYTRTLDATLDILLLTGDFIFALSTYPIRLALDWWNKRYGLYYEPFETEQETQTETDSSNDVNTSEMPTSFLASSGVVNASPEPLPVQAPSKSARTESRRPSADTTTGSISRGKLIESNFPPKKEPTRRPSGSPSGKEPNPTRRASSDATTDTNLEPNFYKPLKTQTSPGTSRHHIWYPPKSSYSDDEHVAIEADFTVRQSSQRVTLSYEEQAEEWRKYPPLPSAYPPTPITKTSKLVTVSSSLDPLIEGEISQQDFHKSLLPPREPLNPSPAGDLSDYHNTFGISPRLSDEREDADDSMSTSDYEEEDEFNITLRTPLQPLGSLRSRIKPRRLVAVASGSSAVSVPSRSSALTTIDHGSSLRTSTSSDSSDSAPEPINTDSSSIIGKKRSYPRSKKALHSATPRVRQIEESGNAAVEASAEISATLRPAPDGTPAKPGYAQNLDTRSDTADESGAATTASSVSPVLADEQDHEQLQPEEKRRKIVRSSASRNARGTFTANPVRSVRARVTRHASPPLRNAQKTKSLGAPTKKPPTRAAAAREAALSADHVKENDSSMGASSSASTSDHPLPPPPVPRKPNKRSTHRNT
ncbi:hypothetical protein M413DRAFT_449867 [Hebeloma cylindrosporum]|uniref:Protein YOP1 n=1 Tax=Hebeloma cylindrosporum TaxID=76867 RepID=A0A0C2XB20_HEBCY|nr:hypothetical protein M413DRAFT_449867 [Hebeloma cylindrosporum h7]